MYKAILPAAVLFSVSTMWSERAPVRPQVIESYGKLPLSFEANQGQTDQRVKFLARGPGYTLFLTGDSAAVLSLHGKDANATLRMNLLGANPHAAVAGANALPGKSNYFVGNDPKQWRTNVPSYASVKYADVYPGIDLVYHGDQRLLEYDFVVAPGADPQAIDLRFQGARKLSVNNDGALVIKVGGTEVIEHAPVVYQDIGGQRQTVRGRYLLRGRGRVGFNIAKYDRSQPLVIDPTLVYSTYLGGNGGYDEGRAIAIDRSGNAYVTGQAASSNFPTTPGAFQTVLYGGEAAFVSKLNAGGRALVYSTYLGGSDNQFGESIAVDASGNAYVTGITGSSNFPTTPGAFQTTVHAGEHAFVSKLNAAGSALVYSTYLGGGSARDYSTCIAVDASDNAYITGWTWSSDFPTTPGSFQTTLRGNSDAFVSKLNPAGSALVYSTYLGGSGDDGFYGGIAVDAAGGAYVTSWTWSSDFPITNGTFQTTAGPAFVSKLNAAGSELVYSTYLGGAAPFGIAVDRLGNAYVTGFASCYAFPTTPGAFQPTCSGSNDAFVTKLNSAGSGLIYSTYLGGSTGDYGYSIAADALGDAYVTGYSDSSNFPTTSDAFPTTLVSGNAAFVSALNVSGSALLYSTYLGSTGYDIGQGIAVDVSGNAYVTGITGSPNFPTTPGAVQTTFGGGTNAFVSKLSFSAPASGPVTTANLTGPLGNNGWYLGAVTVTLSASDPDTPVSATYYQVDGGTEQRYFGSFSISSDGAHQLLFYSVDTANLQETPHGQNFKIDATPPVSLVSALPATATSPNFSVQWSGTDATSGISNFTIYVSDNIGPFTPWLTQTTATQAWFAGSLGHSYAFYSIALDNAGNQEHPVTKANTQVPPQMPGDVNGDGKIDCADIAIVKASFGKRTGQPGFDPRADVNGDGVVDVRDLGIVSQKLIPGTSCP